MIYFDSSAAVTRVLRRQNSVALDDFVASQPARFAMSTIGFVEVVRICDQVGGFPDLMADLTERYAELPVSRDVSDRAAKLPGRLRVLDAIHVATAEILGSELVALVTYDRRMADAARSVGLPVAMPGVD